MPTPPPPTPPGRMGAAPPATSELFITLPPPPLGLLSTRTSLGTSPASSSSLPPILLRTAAAQAEAGQCRVQGLRGSRPPPPPRRPSCSAPLQRRLPEVNAGCRGWVSAALLIAVASHPAAHICSADNRRPALRALVVTALQQKSNQRRQADLYGEGIYSSDSIAERKQPGSK